MSMIQDLETAQARVKELETELAAMKAANTKPATPPPPASLTPMWDRFNAIKNPAARQMFWDTNEIALKAEQKTAGKGTR